MQPPFFPTFFPRRTRCIGPDDTHIYLFGWMLGGFWPRDWRNPPVCRVGNKNVHRFLAGAEEGSYMGGPGSLGVFSFGRQASY